MSRLSRWASILAVLCIVAGMVSLGLAGPASAATGSVSGAVPAVDPLPDINPKAGSAKQFMLNVSGKVLGKAMPDSWRREQIAYSNRFNHSWDKLELQTGIKSAAPAGQLITEDWATKPQTKADYDLKRMEQGLKGGTDGKKMKVPATGVAKFVKTVGGVATAYTGFELGVMAGNGVMGLFGFDSNGAVCGNTGDDVTGKMLQMVSGQDCTAYKTDAAFVPNTDVSGGFSTDVICRTFVTGSQTTNDCAQMTGMGSKVTVANNWSGFGPVGTTVTLVCMGAPAGKRYDYPDFVKGSDGVIRSGTNGDKAVFWVIVDGQTYCGTAAGTGAYGKASTAGWKSPMPDIVGFKYKVNASDTGTTGTFTPVLSSPADPDRTLECSVLGTDSVTYKASSATFKESSGALAPTVCPSLPDGVAPQNVQVDNKPVGGTPTTVSNQPSTPEFLDFWNSYPECRTGACKLDLLQKPALTSCFDAETACVAWFEDASKTTNYQCRYGTHDVPLEECNVYSGVFKKERIAVGAPYSDPMTGTWSGGQSAPAPDKQAMGQPIQSPLVARGCDGMNVTGFDPVGFVMRPIQCALEWAFVPRPAVVNAEFAKSSIAWAGTPPGKLIATVGAWNIAPTLSGCSGIPFTMQGKTMNFLDACAGKPLAPVAQWSNTISGFLFVAGGVFAIISMVSSVIGYRGLTVAGGNH